MAHSDENIRKARVSGPFKKTGRYRTCQIPAPAFKVHVHLRDENLNPRLGGSTHNGERDWSPIFSDYTAGNEETIDCTLVDRALANP